MSDGSLMAVPSEQEATHCANCGAELVADQRYCLSCGQPVSAVRLSFLDVLQPDSASQAQPWVTPYPLEAAPNPRHPPGEGPAGWIRRNTGFISLVSVLLMCLIVGLLVGHWVTQRSATPAASSGPTTIKVEGLGSLASTAGAATATAPSNHGAAKSTSVAGQEKKEEAEEKREAAEEERKPKAPPAKTVKLNSSKLQKLSKTTGRKHEEELAALEGQPIETG